MIKVSVIVPVYNKENSLKKCLDSLVNQTLKEIEIIIINDGSKDKSAKIIKNYQKKYKQIIFIDNKKNQGIGKTRNIGLERAKGKYIGFVDSDDYIDRNMYQKYYEFCEKNKVELMYSNYYKVFDDRKEVFKTPSCPFSNVRKNKEILNLIDYGPCNKLFLKKNIDTYHIRFEEKIKYEDMPFVIKNLYHAKKVGHLDSAYYYYSIHDGSETTTMDERVYDIFKVMDIVNDYYKDPRFSIHIEALNIYEITMYMAKQREQKEKKLRNDFIEYGYSYLEKNFPNWKKNEIYKKENFLKRMVKNHPLILKFYCSFYNLRRKK